MDRLLPVASRVAGARTLAIHALRPRMAVGAGTGTISIIPSPGLIAPPRVSRTGVVLISRPFLTFGRQANRGQQVLPQPTTHTLVYQVRHRRRRWMLRLRYALTVTTVFLFAYSTYNTLVIDRLYSSLLEWMQSLPPEILKRILEEGDEDDEDSYIPIPLTLRHEPPKRHALNSPEWQTFIRVSHDKALVEKIHADVGRAVMSALDAHFRGLLGNPVRHHSQFSLDWEVLPPFGTFVQKVLALEEDEDEGTIALVVRDCELPWNVGSAMWTTVYPKHVAHAIKAFLLTMMKGDLALLHQRFIASEPQPSKSPNITPSPFTPQQPPAQRTNRSQQGNQSSDKPTTSTLQPPANTSSVTPGQPAKPTASPATSSLSNNPPTSSSAAQPMPQLSQAQRIQQTVGSAIAAMHKRGSDARKAFGTEWARKRPNLPNHDLHGCITVTGQFNYVFDQGYCTAWVQAWWDPKTQSVLYTILDKKRVKMWRKQTTQAAQKSSSSSSSSSPSASSKS